MPLSTYLENALLNHVLRHVSLTSPVTVYVAVYSDSLDADGNGTQVGSRVAVTFSAPSSGRSSPTADVTFTGWDGSTAVSVGIWDAASSGNLLMYADFDDPIQQAAGSSLVLPKDLLIAAFQ